jgi:hypothetical protein
MGSVIADTDGLTAEELRVDMIEPPLSLDAG